MGVQFQIDGQNLGAEDTVRPYVRTWRTGTFVNGTHTITAVARDAAGNVTTSAPVTVTIKGSKVGSTTVQNVIWTALVNATASGNSVQKTSGCDGCDDAGAISQQRIAAGSGYLEFTASETSGNRVIGLSHGNTNSSRTDIDFGIQMWHVAPPGNLEVREKGVYKIGTTYVTGDVFRIAVESGVVKYYKNGTVFYTSAAAPAYPLLVDTALFRVNSTIANAVLLGAQ